MLSRDGCRLLAALAFFAAAGSTAFAQPALPESMTASPAERPDRDVPEAIRQFMLEGRSTLPLETENDAWLEYITISAKARPDLREEALRDLLDSDVPDSLRHVVLREFETDVSYQSRRARFIRRYGFYSAWFNRVTYAASRTLQGNVQAAGQLVVDAVFDLFRAKDVTAAERRLYKLLQRMQAEGRSARSDREELTDLEEKINRAMAEVDLERAHWALSQSWPEMAEFYARGALGLDPENEDAAELLSRAQSEIARRRRAYVASAQTGFPDRHPPIEPTSPELLRAALSRRRDTLLALANVSKNGEAPQSILPQANPPDEADEKLLLYPGDAFLAYMLATLSGHDESTFMDARGWAKSAKDFRELPPEKTAWLEQLLVDPRINPDVRLARAEASRRGSLARFIFVGPETERERAYKYSSALAQTWNFASSIGLFYVFEVIYRAAVAGISPPQPADELFDAQATFLRAAPQHEEAKEIADDLAEQYDDAGRFDDARRVLDRFGLLTAERSQELFRHEARRLLVQAESLPPGDPRRAPLLQKVSELAPGTGLSKKAMKELDRLPEPEKTIVVTANWNATSRWLKLPGPAGLPGRPEWFDGEPANGEIETPLYEIESEGESAEHIRIRYTVLESGERRAVEETFEIATASEPLANWIRMHLAERARLDRELGNLGRTRIPYEVKGGVGLSGVDFYPKLLPIETNPGELRLYQD